MSEEFKVIETQEQLDAVIKGRLERAEKKYSEATAELQTKYDTALSELEALKSTNTELTEQIKGFDEKYKGYDTEVADLKAKVKQYETDSVKTRIAREVGLPYEMRDRLRGETEDEIKADAEALVKLIPKNQTPPKSTESSSDDYFAEKYGKNQFYKK